MQIKFLMLNSFLLMSLVFLACSKDDNDMGNIPPDTSTFVGNFVSSAHATSGTASVNEDETLLTLKNFKTDSGPDLNIYLASDIANVEGDYIDLGDIKGLDGDYTYDLSASTDYTKYKYVVVWCVAFHVNFGYATLEPQ